MERGEPRAVLITGIYGTGKTSVVEEIADILEGRGVRYAALDLDWLGWFAHGDEGGDHDAGWPVKRKNIEAVVGNYLKAGVVRVAMAGSFGTAERIEELRETIAIPLSVVRVTVPIDEIERRLSSYVTAGREDDLEVARRWSAEGLGEGVGDFVLENDGPIRDVAQEIVAFLGW